MEIFHAITSSLQENTPCLLRFSGTKSLQTFRNLPKIHKMKSVMPKTPYYAVIFTSTRTKVDNGYGEIAEHMVSLASQQDGFLGVESAREEIGITVSYWRDLEAIKCWREHAEHTLVIEKGRKDWYQSFTVRIAKVERAYDFHKD